MFISHTDNDESPFSILNKSFFRTYMIVLIVRTRIIMLLNFFRIVGLLCVAYGASLHGKDDGKITNNKLHNFKQYSQIWKHIYNINICLCAFIGCMYRHFAIFAHCMHILF